MGTLATHGMFQHDAVDWSGRRAAVQPPDELGQHTIRWMAELPVGVRPRRLPIEFPRIANRLSGVWAEPRACLAYLDDLLIDNRGTRRGFPLAVAMELASLKNHYETVVHPVPQTIWDEIAAAAGRRAS